MVRRVPCATKLVFRYIHYKACTVCAWAWAIVIFALQGGRGRRQMSVWQDISVRGMGWMGVDTREET